MFLEEKIKKHEIYVFIDTLRATSTITTLIFCGAKEIIVKRDYDDYLKYKNNDFILVGERNSIIINEFDYDNSPYNIFINKRKIENRKIFLSTTNGAKTFEKVNNYSDVVALSLLNINSISKFLENFNDIGIICSGTDNTISLEDSFTAGKLIYKLLEKFNFTLNDSSYITLSLAEKPLDYIFNSLNSIRLIKFNKKNDLDFCFQNSLFDVIPFAKKGTNIFNNLILKK
jgi:2-phosphosulfolactate phosphatase